MAIITGTTSANLLNGTPDADEISGLGGNDTLKGASGNDTLIGGTGADSLVGGGGNDTYTIDASDILVEAGTGIDMVLANFSYTLLAGFENLVLTGAFSINGTGNTAANLITGNNLSNTLTGGGNNDTLNGGVGNDSLLGEGGSDSLNGGAGNDTMTGGTGSDIYVADAVGDVVTEISAQGADLVQASIGYTLLADFEHLTLVGSADINGTGNGVGNTVTGNSKTNLLSGLAGEDTLRGAGGNDTLLGGIENDSLVGGAGADSLVGDAGVDTLAGEGGNDTYVIDASDILVESGGIDTVRADFSYTLLSGFENLILTGSSAINGTGNAAANALTGNDAANLVAGAGNDDVLTGNGGADTLNGGSGADMLLGGGGNDVLIHDAADGSVYGGAGSDTLRVGGGGVTLDLTVVSNAVHQDLEVIDLTGGGNNALSLAQGDLLAISSTTDVLRVDGNAGDAVTTADGGWLLGPVVAYGGGGYVQYANGDAVLLVDASVERTGVQLAATIELSSLNGTNGFRLNGIDASDYSGRSVSGAGDVNGDGFDDVIIGAGGADPGGDSNAGESYVVFGTASGFTSSFNLATLNGVNGFRLNGIDAEDRSGGSVAAAGDVNGDGFADLIIGAQRAAPGGDSGAGESYVVFGKASGFASSINLATLNGANGFRLDGIDASDYSGRSVASAGDVNGDGFADLIIGADRADPGGDSAAGESYVVFGKASGFTSSINLATLNGADGFRLNGVDAGQSSGYSVASAGDVNGDGFDDLTIGNRFDSQAGVYAGGATYVVFGKASGFASIFDLAALDGTDGFRLDSVNVGDYSGRSVASAGDVNGDGFDDLIIGAYWASPGGNKYAGESYVVFGKASGFTSNINLAALNGADGFVLNGIREDDESGGSVSSAGDVNGDGFDDLIIGATLGGPFGYEGGESYVLFGKASGFTSTFDLSALNGANGFRLEGIDFYDLSGSSVAAAGDVNGDGFDDLIIGAQRADPGGDSNAGESYVVFGGDFTGAVTHLGTATANTLTGTAAAEVFVSGQGNDTLTGGGSADVFNAGAGNDLIQVSNTAFRDVDGGSGNDTLAILGSGRTLNLVALANNKITGVEKIDIAGSGDNTLRLAQRDLFDLSDTTNQLKVNGNAGDTVDLVGTWTDEGVSGAFHTYTRGAATILIDTDIFVT